jgi:hypothetical protein
MRSSHGLIIPSRWCDLGITLIGAFSLLIGANQASAQVTTNAHDAAAHPAYTAGRAGGNGGNNLGNLACPNGGLGFGPWTFTLSGGLAGTSIDLVGFGSPDYPQRMAFVTSRCLCVWPSKQAGLFLSRTLNKSYMQVGDLVLWKNGRRTFYVLATNNYIHLIQHNP